MSNHEFGGNLGENPVMYVDHGLGHIMKHSMFFGDVLSRFVRTRSLVSEDEEESLKDMKGLTNIEAF
jgi:hypothetical protein